MADRRPDYTKFPYRKNADGKPLCRVCGEICLPPRSAFCSPKCVRDFHLQTNWGFVRHLVLTRDMWRCMTCGKYANHVDHIIPVARGGDPWDLSNLQASCEKCNLTKGSKTEAEMQALQESFDSVLLSNELACPRCHRPYKEADSHYKGFIAETLNTEVHFA